ncbi:CAP domain-containing protein [Stutzerimonas tarimensis]|uniref:CAP domain-containing protein n=1 Tax=Stutzerimonas tarimensis TaxID=1507735 RepID=A0ABV7SZV0_9GAMM
MNRQIFRTACLLAYCGLLQAGAAHADESLELITLINDYREAPGECEGRRVESMGPLVPDDDLSRLRLASGDDWRAALQEIDYQAASAQAVVLSGLRDASATMGALHQNYCQLLLDPQFADIGVSREGNSWHLVLARPLLEDGLGDWQQAGQEILRQVNETRGAARRCGGEHFEAAPPLRWNEQLANAALAHSRDMADKNYFSHQGRDGSQVSDRINREDYTWRQVGENIAAGQGSPSQAISGWLASPGHCANIMNPNYQEMGAAYALEPQSDAAIYWTQVFATPR